MKKYIYLTNLFLSVFFLSGCADFLDRQPLDQISRETFYKTELDVQQGLVSTYLRMRGDVIGGMGSGNGSSVDIEVLTDNAYSVSSFMEFQTIGRGLHTASTGGGITSMWNQCWQGVAYCNFFLDNLEREEVKGLLPEANYKKYKGEALFNRCYYYHLLAEHFGDIPWIETSVTPESPYLGFARDPKSKIVTEILKDIDIAIDGLPLPAAGYTDGHAIKSSAIMLKVRILMANGKYQEAVTAAELLIKNPQNPHYLADDFSGIFFGKQRNNPEIIFSVQYEGATDQHSFDQYTASRFSCYPVGDLAIAYGHKANGDPDPRLRMTMFVVGDPWVMHNIESPIATGEYTYPNGLGTFSYTLGQFIPKTSPEIPHQAEQSVPAWSLGWKKGVDTTVIQPRGLSTQHRVMMRYADLLLLYAEAKVEVAGGTTTDPDALAAFNAVRTRQGVNMPEETALTRELVRNERRVELAYEGVRIYDIMRWNIGKEVIARKTTSAGNNGVANAPGEWKSNLWPIPQNVMNIMIPSADWEQNEEY